MKASAPAAPDYTPIAEADARIAEQSLGLAEQQFEWGQEQYQQTWPYAQQYLEAQIGALEDQQQFGAEQQQFYTDVYRPIEAEFARQALDYASPARQEAAAASAITDVTNTFDASRRAALSTLESYGIDPSQTRFGALDLGARVQQAAASAAAATNARRATEAVGLGLMGEAINIGRGYPGAVASAYGTATNAGKAGLSGANETTQTGGYTMGSPTAYLGAANVAQANQAGALNYGFNNAATAAQIQNQNTANMMSGIGSLAGGALGLGFGMGWF